MHSAWHRGSVQCMPATAIFVSVIIFSVYGQCSLLFSGLQYIITSVFTSQILIEYYLFCWVEASLEQHTRKSPRINIFQLGQRLHWLHISFVNAPVPCLGMWVVMVMAGEGDNIIKCCTGRRDFSFKCISKRKKKIDIIELACRPLQDSKRHCA